MVTPQSQLGLGLGLPNSGSLYNHSRDPQIYKHSSSGSMDGSHPVFSHSQMMSVAATVVGSLPNEQLPDGPSRPGQGRSGSDDTVRTLPDMDPRKYSAAHLKLTRCRVRSEPTSTVVVDRIDSESSPAIPRVDSLLHLGSEVASKDLNKLLNARVRQAPLSIDIDKANGPSTSSTADSPTKDGPRSSRLETEKSRPRVELYFDLNNQVAVEGGLISGSLTVRTRKPRRGEARHVRIDGGKIRVLGYEGVSESERYAFYQCTASLVDAAGNLSQLYESSADSEGFHIAREGTFTTAFKMHIPQPSDSQSKKSAPKGVIQDGSISATIKYILLVSFKVRDDSDNATGLDKRDPLCCGSFRYSFVQNSQELFLGGSGMLHLTAVLHRKIWLAGQKCTVYIGVWNETRKFVKALNLAIIRKTSLTRPNQNETTGRKQIAEVTLDAFRGPSFGAVTGKGWWAGIEPGSSSELSYMISIPIDALTVPRTHIIEISYVLRVSLITGSLSSNVSVDLPLVIINALSTDGIPTPPPPGLLTGSLKLPKDAPVLFSFKTPRTKDNANIDLRTWSYPHASPRETSPFPRDYILDWTKRTSAHPPCETDPSPIRSDYTHGSISLPVSARASPRIGDTSTTSESVSNLITQLESDLDSIGQTVSADQERRSVRFAHQNDKRDPSASDTLKARSSTKHRVTFMMPIQLDADMGSVFPPSSEYSPQVSSGTGHYTGLRQQPLVKKLNPQDREPISVNPDKDIWTSDDADAILNSIRPDTQTFCTSSLSSLSHTQEIVADRPSSGLYTASTSTSTSEPWSSSGTTTDCHSGTDHYYSRFDAPGPGFRNPPARYDLQDISSAPGSQSSDRQRAESLLTEDTPRAGSVRRFQPELIAGAIQMSASRATLVSAASSPMLAKSQSAYVIGSPVNQYRRKNPALFEGETKTERRTYTLENPLDKSVASIRHSPRQLDNDLRTSRIHLRAHSTPQPRENQDMGIAPSQSTVRSRIAALEERSRGRPSSSYS
ncbi:Arrestin (or S-antigen), C-terminal domain [Rhizoctonia solani]|uniref:Arrestin (Or S-antigen), C-terminal domain n=1 Tax=Rhizoctonia solani TaxID=456999 RepID=A0A8H7IBZ9_9AGAM|nr:Arrestin (or S-antigen), C-terminal domain [Rhizoctonia solani]